jgi:hypothetical protein
VTHLVVIGAGIAAETGSGEGEAADAAGERAVVAGAAARVGERLVGLLHLDEAARVLRRGARRGHVRVVRERHPPVGGPDLLGAPLRRDPEQVVERPLRLLLLLPRRRVHAAAALPSDAPRAQVQARRRRPGAGGGPRPPRERDAAGAGGGGSGGGGSEVGHVAARFSLALSCFACRFGFRGY